MIHNIMDHVLNNGFIVVLQLFHPLIEVSALHSWHRISVMSHIVDKTFFEEYNQF